MFERSSLRQYRQLIVLININVKQHSNRSGRTSHQDVNTNIKGKQKYEHHRKYFAIASVQSAEILLRFIT